MTYLSRNDRWNSPKFLIGEIFVWNSIVIERRTDPPFILRVLPGMDVADARNLHLVGFNGRGGCHRPGGKAKFLNRLAKYVHLGVRNNEGAGAKLVTLKLEVVFRRKHLYAGVFEAE